MGTGTGTNQIWAQEGGKHKALGHRSDSYSTLPIGASRDMRHTTSNGLDGGLVLARGRTLSRHRRIPSLQHSPVVSGRSTGRCQLAPCQNSELMVASTRAVFVASPQNSRAYSANGRSRRAGATNRAAISMPRGENKRETKNFSQNGNKTRGKGLLI